MAAISYRAGLCLSGYFWDGIGTKDNFEKPEVENCMYIFEFKK
jgi:hypothetical protein